MSRRLKKKTLPLKRAGPIIGNGMMYVPPGQQQGTMGQVFYGSKANIPVGQQAFFSPGIPLAPQPNVNPGGYPIQWKFPIAVNTFPVDRTSGLPDIPSFQVLRNLAKTYNGITLCERAWMDMVPRMVLNIGLKPEYVALGADEKEYQPEISYFKTWFEKPDRMHDIHTWIRMALREQTQIDELYIFKRKKRGGGLYSLEVIAGDQFKPLLDNWGKIPAPPDQAFQQYPWGLPGAGFTTDEMIHYQESPAADNPYGQSRIERIIILVNQALRKQRKDMSYFTENNIPLGMMLVPEESNWTPDQIDTYEQAWNSLMAGNPVQQARMRFLQPGMKYQAFEQYELNSDFDKFILNIAVSSYGMSMQDLAFTEDIHKSSGDSQQNVTYRRTIDPLALVYASFFTTCMNNDFDPDLHGEMFEASFGGYDEEEDVSSLATAYSTLTGAGILGLSNAGRLMKLPDDPNSPNIGRVYMTQAGPIFLDDMATDKMRNAQMQSQLQGFQQAATAPSKKSPSEEKQPAEESPQEPVVNEKQPKTEKQSLARATQQPNTPDPDDEEDGEEEKDEEVEELVEEEEEDEPTAEDLQQEAEIAFHLTSDSEEPFSELERYYAEGYIPEYTEDELLERHTPGGHEHDQKTHGDFSHPAYGAKHDTSPAAKAAMAATPPSSQAKLQAAQAKVTSAQAKVVAAAAKVKSAAKADKPAARTALKQARADLKQARVAVHTLKTQDKVARQQLAAKVHAAKVKAATEKKADAAQAKTAKTKVQAQAKEKAADVKEAKVKIAAEKKSDAAQAKAQALKARVQKQAVAAKAKAAHVLATAQAQAQIAAVKAAKSTTHPSSKQSHVQLQAAKAQVAAAKKTHALATTLGAKATLYNALAGRKISKTWTAQDAHDAQTVATNLHDLLQVVNAHGDESSASTLLKNITHALSSLQIEKGVSQASASVLDKLLARIQPQLSRSVLAEEEETEWEEEEEEIDEEEEEAADSIDQEKRYTVGELLQFLSQQMQAEATDQESRAYPPRSEEVRMAPSADSRATQQDKALIAEYRRWKERAIDDVKANRGQRGFTSVLIPEEQHKWISSELEVCTSVEEVRDVFSQARVQEQNAPVGNREELIGRVHAVFQHVADRSRKQLLALEEK